MNKQFLRNASLAKVKGSLRTIVGDEAGMLDWSHFVNDLYVLGREASKDFETKTFSDIFQKIYYLYQSELEGGIEAEHLGCSILT